MLIYIKVNEFAASNKAGALLTRSCSFHVTKKHRRRLQKKKKKETQWESQQRKWKIHGQQCNSIQISKGSRSSRGSNSNWNMALEIIWCDVFRLLRFFFSFLLIWFQQMIRVCMWIDAAGESQSKPKETDCLPTKCMCYLISSQFIRIWNTEMKYICYCYCYCWCCRWCLLFFLWAERETIQQESNAAGDLEKCDRIQANKRSRRAKKKTISNNKAHTHKSQDVGRHYMKNESHIARANYSNLRWSTNCLGAVAWNSNAEQ